MKTGIEKDKRRIAEIDTMIERLYDDNVLGKIPGLLYRCWSDRRSKRE